ncbi:thioredoxin domain-containing protein [Nocardioides sp. BGMRC 2183]|nr:thioredoxin domain-containing protein [Nocardioides sp. BGMRC 2183]
MRDDTTSRPRPGPRTTALVITTGILLVSQLSSAMAEFANARATERSVGSIHDEKGRRSRVRLRAKLAIAAAVAVLGGVFLAAGLSADPDQDADTAVADAAPSDGAPSDDPAAEDDPGLARRDPDDPMALGSVDAPVAIVEYADMRCPFCAKYASETLPKLVEQYVDTGLVRYEFRDLPLFGQQSMDAALAGRAAAEQGRFWEYFHTVYDAAPAEGHPDLPREKLLALAEDAGVPDMAAFRAALGNADLRSAIDTDTSEATRLGINSVPFFAIDNVAVSGAQPLEVFQNIIDERLQAHGVTTNGSADN